MAKSNGDACNTNGMGFREYLVSRVTSLKPPMDKAVNPIKAMRLLTKEQWNFFGCAWSGWIIDSFDFFTVSLTLPYLARDFNKRDSDITWGIFLTLMLRPIGSLLFGYLSDRYGRRWPFIINNLMLIVLELGTGFCETFEQFLICRAFFGVAMGGIYGNSVATALEDCPNPSRGIMSGLFHACPPVLIILWRFMLPETRAFRERQLASKTSGTAAASFGHKTWIAVKGNWITIVYMVFLMSGFQFISHGALDLYPTMLSEEFEFTPNQLTATQVVANIGGFLGAICIGNLSDIFGRRLAIITSCAVAASVLYPYTRVQTPAVTAAAFFLQFAIQGAFGVLPSYLMELSPADIRSIVVGTAYQLGTMASSGSATIQSEIGENYFPLPPSPAGQKRYDYGLVICAFLGAAIALVMMTTFVGPENKGCEFGLDVDEATESSETRKGSRSGFKSENESIETGSV
ncbi:hypothetical protein EsHS_00002643 [Epichloe bromicola]